jgi:hypothetical protein
MRLPLDVTIHRNGCRDDGLRGALLPARLRAFPAA